MMITRSGAVFPQGDIFSPPLWNWRQKWLAIWESNLRVSPCQKCISLCFKEPFFLFSVFNSGPQKSWQKIISLISSNVPGPMISIVRDQVVYNAGSNLEVVCLYRNSTGGKDGASDNGGGPDHLDERSKEVLRQIQQSKQGFPVEVPEDTVVWLHNGKRFSHRNRRRCVKKVRFSPVENVWD